MEQWPIVIVGAGPAGAATALFLLRRLPALAGQIVILEKAIHPRFKVCAGGLIGQTRDCLEELGIPLEIPYVEVSRAVALTPTGEVVHDEGRAFCTVVRRDCFDALLVSHCTFRGAILRQGEKVTDVVEHPDFVEVRTERASYRASIVVGADGSGSVVRRRIFGSEKATVGRATMVDIPADASGRGFPEEPSCKFDFRPVARRLRGYMWMFPCYIDGIPHWNVGVYSSRANGQGRRIGEFVKPALFHLGDYSIRPHAHPIRLFDSRARLASRRVLLVGDAAGVDPLMGEGISYAMQYGRLAAECIAKAWQRGDRLVADYEAMVHQSWVGRKLRRLGWLERMLYGPTFWVWFQLATWSTQARRLGLRWYSGEGGWDRLTFPRALLRLAREASFAVGRQGRWSR